MATTKADVVEWAEATEGPPERSDWSTLRSRVDGHDQWGKLGGRTFSDGWALSYRADAVALRRIGLPGPEQLS
jgi:hypothetical protein